jgi:hypothetical protein
MTAFIRSWKPGTGISTSTKSIKTNTYPNQKRVD